MESNSKSIYQIRVKSTSLPLRCKLCRSLLAKSITNLPDYITNFGRSKQSAYDKRGFSINIQSGKTAGKC